jgi:hypothetical protein
MIIINKRNFVKEMLSKIEMQTLIEVLIFIAGFLIMILGIFINRYSAFFVGAIAYIIGGYLYESKITQARIWRAGLFGQKAVEITLSELDDKFYLINNLSLPFKNCDIDHLIIGPNGIFLIETKNYKGEVSCNGDVWEYQKIGKMGGFYKGHISNPSRQLKRNIWELKSYLDKKSKRLFGENLFPYWIQGLVVFTNEETYLKITDETVIIMKINELMRFIKEFKKEKIPVNDITKIVNVLKDI